MSAHPLPDPAQDKPAVALVLQGGGALGAYHIGAYQALEEAGFHPDWVCGISIGAINAAIVAGNPPERRVEQLQAMWDAISWPDIASPFGFAPFQRFHNITSNAEALLLGQPNFFAPRAVSPYLIANAPTQEVSFYDASPMLSTLRRFADFDLINSRSVRLSLGATNIETGELEFFDNTRTSLGPEHVLASGSLPPAFAAMPVGGHLYWDGACVSNAPLEAIIDDPNRPRLVAFVIDLWDAAGPPPENIPEVLWRAKQIQYASRVAYCVDAVATKVNLRHAMRLLKESNAPQSSSMPEMAWGAAPRLDIVHIIYHAGADQIPNSDAEFSRNSIAERRGAGYRDLRAAIEAAPWFRREMPAHLGALVHRVENQSVTTMPEPDLSMAPRSATRGSRDNPNGRSAG